MNTLGKLQAEARDHPSDDPLLRTIRERRRYIAQEWSAVAETLANLGMRQEEKLAARITGMEAYSWEVRAAVRNLFPLLRQTDPPGRDGGSIIRTLEAIDRAASDLQNARNEFASKHGGLVGFVADKYKGADLSYQDLYNEGWKGLLRAVERYRAGEGALSSFAHPAIKREIRRAIQEERQCHATSLDAPLARENDCEGVSLMTLMENEQSADPAMTAAENMVAGDMRTLVYELPEPDQTVIGMLFGIGRDEGPSSVAEVATIIRESSSRVVQIKNRALRRLREKLKRRKITDGIQ